MRSYLDHNATTPLRPQARAAMIDACELAGNPSSVHAEGRAARAVLDAARRSVAMMVGSTAEHIVFTSGGTEALNIALTPELSRAGRGMSRLLVGAGEHPAVLSGHRFGDAVATVPLCGDGRLDLGALDRLVGGDAVLLAIQAANNETGVLQPVREAAERVHATGGLVVCDGVQAVGKIGCDMAALGVDALAISAHKFGGPKGVGALCFAPDGPHLMRGVIRGGGQERGLRSGTENLGGIAAMAAACEAASDECDERAIVLARWRDAIEVVIRAAVPTVVVFGDGAERLPNTSCFALPGYDAGVVLMGLDLAGVAVSAGSACAAGTVKPSHVLAAMGVAPALATRALRVSLGWTTTAADIDAFAGALATAVRTIRPRIAA